MLANSPDNLSHAVLQTVAYADVFDYPLSGVEIHRYLTGVSAPFDVVTRTLEENSLVTRTGDYFTLPGREAIVSIRAEREAHSKKLLPRAIRFGRILGALPYIRMVALTGSLAVMNVSENTDFDYLLVTVPGRLWTARAFALAFNRLAHVQGFTLCPNLILSEKALEWPSHDLYSARELCQIIPISGFDVYSRLMNANQWVKTFLPNCSHDFSREQSATTPALAGVAREVATTFSSFIEFSLRGGLGGGFEAWEMNRKVARFQLQAGFGEETVFNADICQGNFDHHRARTRQGFEKRLAEFELVS